MDAILCAGLGKRYGAVAALHDLSLTVPEGSVFGFLGPNGAGKSTAIRSLATLSRPSAGDAAVAGRSVTADPMAVRRLIGYLPQQPAFPGWMRGEEFLRFAAELSGIASAERRARAAEVLSLVGLADAGRRRIGGYSGGMVQRLGLAQALLHRPPVLILDEPVSALDPLGRREVLEIIGRLRGRTTVFLSSHILDDIDRICDRVAILSAGRLVVQDTVAGLKERYAQPAFEIDIEGDAASLLETLARQPWVVQATARGGGIRVLVRDVARAERDLPSLVLAGGHTLRRYEQVLPSLEDIFVRLVGEEAAA